MQNIRAFLESREKSRRKVKLRPPHTVPSNNNGPIFFFFVMASQNGRVWFCYKIKICFVIKSLVGNRGSDVVSEPDTILLARHSRKRDCSVTVLGGWEAFNLGIARQENVYPRAFPFQLFQSTEILACDWLRVNLSVKITDKMFHET